MWVAKTAGRARQGEFSLSGMIGWAIVIVMVGTVLMKLFVPINEYLSLRRVVASIKADNPVSVAEVLTAFNNRLRTEYAITSVTSQDLKVEFIGDGPIISFAYSREVELLDPLYLTIKFRGSTH